MTFDEFWASEIKANSGHQVGADYRHWAKAGWDAAIKQEREQAKERHANLCEEESDAFQDNHNMQAMSGADRCAIRIRSAGRRRRRSGCSATWRSIPPTSLPSGLNEKSPGRSRGVMAHRLQFC